MLAITYYVIIIYCELYNCQEQFLDAVSIKFFTTSIAEQLDNSSVSDIFLKIN